MRRKRARPFHIHTFFDCHLGLYKNLTLVRRSGPVPHNIFIQIPFRRAEFPNLHSIGICTCNHHDNAVQHPRCTASDFVAAFLAGNRLYIHNRLRIRMILFRYNNVDLQIKYQILGIYTFFFNSFPDIQCGAFDLRLRAAFYFCNLIMLSRQCSDNFFPVLPRYLRNSFC